MIYLHSLFHLKIGILSHSFKIQIYDDGDDGATDFKAWNRRSIGMALYYD